MSLLKMLFGSKQTEKPQFEGIARRIFVDQNRYEVRVKKDGKEMYAEDLFRSATDPKNIQFSRFYLLKEDHHKPHLAPSLEQAISWFRGRELPRDGYQNIAWGDETRYKCPFCQREVAEPLKITKIERLTVCTTIPTDIEIVGWRVIEVATDQMGPGIPTKFMDQERTWPVIKWLSGKKKYICENCAQRLRRTGRGEELEDCAIFR